MSIVKFTSRHFECSGHSHKEWSVDFKHHISMINLFEVFLCVKSNLEHCVRIRLKFKSVFTPVVLLAKILGSIQRN